MILQSGLKCNKDATEKIQSICVVRNQIWKKLLKRIGMFKLFVIGLKESVLLYCKHHIISSGNWKFYSYFMYIDKKKISVDCKKYREQNHYSGLFHKISFKPYWFFNI